MIDLFGGVCFAIWAIIGIKRLQTPKIATIIVDTTTKVEYIVTTWGGIHVRLDNTEPSQAPGSNLDATQSGPAIYHV